MRAIERQGALQPFVERHGRLPSELPSDARNVRHEIARFDLLGQWRPVDELDAAAAGELGDPPRHVNKPCADAGSHVVRPSVADGRSPQSGEGFRDIIYIDVISPLA